jgi:O-antigen/teichoic acid export membrane protein
MPAILGTDYSPAVSLVQILFLYPLFLGLLGTGIDLLRGIGMQLTRTYIMIFMSILSVPTSYVFILMFNIKGVAYAKIFIIFLTVTIVWLFIFKINNLERKDE